MKQNEIVETNIGDESLVDSHKTQKGRGKTLTAKIKDRIQKIVSNITISSRQALERLSYLEVKKILNNNISLREAVSWFR